MIKQLHVINLHSIDFFQNDMNLIFFPDELFQVNHKFVIYAISFALAAASIASTLIRLAQATTVVVWGSLYLLLKTFMKTLILTNALV